MSCGFLPVWRGLQRLGLNWRRVEQGFWSKLLNYQITHLPNPAHKTVKVADLQSFGLSKNHTVDPP